MLSDVFASLPATSKHVLDVPTGAHLFRQGDPTRGMFMIERGAVQMVRHGPGGERVILHRSQAGDCFAEASVFADHYHCDALAVEASRILLIEREAVQAAFEQATFARAFARHLARQLQLQRQQIEIIAIRSAEDRVLAGLLAGLLKGTVTDFAAKLHLSPEATYRALRTLTRQGRVSQKARGQYELIGGGHR